METTTERLGVHALVTLSGGGVPYTLVKFCPCSFSSVTSRSHTERDDSTVVVNRLASGNSRHTLTVALWAMRMARVLFFASSRTAP